MTNEEAIKWFRENPFYHKDHVPFNMAIKALEQVDILDKIRTEIEQIAKDYDKFDDYRHARGLWIALEIIDKYKQEG